MTVPPADSTPDRRLLRKRRRRLLNAYHHAVTERDRVYLRMEAIYAEIMRIDDVLDGPETFQ